MEETRVITIADVRETQRLIFYRGEESFSHGEPWTEEKDRELTEFARMSYSRAQISKMTGRSIDAITTRATLLGVRFTRDTYGGSHKASYDRPTYEKRKEQEERDRGFIRALAAAIYRGDHLPGASNVR